MTDTIIQIGWYAGAAAVVLAALAGLARQQIYEYRVNKRVRALAKIRRNR